MAADHAAVYYNPGVQAGAGQALSNQNSDQFAAESLGQEGAGGIARHLDTHAHDSEGPAGSYGVEFAEPVFSDVSGLQPVYNFRVRSSYNNGRVMYVRTSYNPAEPAVMPVYQVYPQNIPASQNIQTNVQVKGRQSGF